MPLAKSAPIKSAEPRDRGGSGEGRDRTGGSQSSKLAVGKPPPASVTQLPVAQDAGASGSTKAHDTPIIVLAARRHVAVPPVAERLPSAAECAALYRRAQLLWPRLDSRALGRTHGDPRRVARLVARRTCLSEEAIVDLLERER